MLMKSYIEKCIEGNDLSVQEAAEALDLIMTNQATEIQVAGLLVALRAKGETEDELVGFARTMRERAIRIRAEDPNAIDMCGTGGDRMGTFNISTVASLVVAGAGVTVAKHGNRSVSSRSGSADVLAALGVNIQVGPERVEACVNTVGIGFLFAPLFHPAMKYAGKPRAELGVRTIFNMVGPLTNPAGVRRQLMGVYSAEVSKLLAGALRKLDSEKACVVHSEDGLDEVTTSAPTTVHEISGASPLRSYTVDAASFGLKAGSASSVKGGTVEENAGISRRILERERGPERDVVVANAALGLYVAEKARDLKEARALAEESIDSGRALASLNRLVEFTNAQ